jgi:tripartite-type tricarboxylate transporter receptor subunit TctC
LPKLPPGGVGFPVIATRSEYVVGGQNLSSINALYLHAPWVLNLGGRAMTNLKRSRRQFLRLAGALAAIPLNPQLASALDYPVKPVRMIVPFAAGGSTDIAGRLMAQWLSERLGQQFLVENRAGAGGNIGTELVVHAPPDGYTLLVAGASNAINATLYEKLNFDFARDLAPVASMVRVPVAMEVNPSFPAKTVPEFIAYAKANPSKINMASAGIGTLSHLAGELFKLMAGVNMLHVPYRGEGSALTDLIGGQVDVMFGGVAAGIEHIRAGRLRALAVGTAMRLAVLPDIPTQGEFLPGYEASAWYGVVVPRNTSAEIIIKLNKEINAGLADRKMIARLADLSLTVAAGSSADFGKFIADETEKWGKVVKASGAKAD